MFSTDSSQTLKRQASSETVRTAKHTRYSAEEIWNAMGVFSNGVSRSSSHVDLPPCPAGDGSNERPSHQNRSSTSISIGAHAGHKHNLSANYAVEVSHQISSQSARIEHGHQPNASLSRIIAVPAEQNSRSHGSWEKRSKENGNETQQEPFPQPSKGKEREEVTGSPRPPLRVINTHPEPDESPLPAPPPFSVQSQSATVRVGNAVLPVISPSEIVGDASTWSNPVFAADYSAASPIHVASGNYTPSAAAPMHVASAYYTQSARLQLAAQYAQYLDMIGQAVPRASLRIKLAEVRTTFCAEHGGHSILEGRLEVTDTIHESYYHHTQIVVRSNVEHPDEPQFIAHYKEPLRHYGSDPCGGVNVASVEATGVAGRGQPPIHFMQDGIADKLYSNAEAEIRTAEWVQLQGVPIPAWAKYFTVPIPDRLFETRELRFFRLEANISFLSMLNGQQYELRAPTVQVSMSRLVNARELDVPWPRPSGHPFDQAY